MTNELAPFTYIGRQVRVLMRDGEPWFVLADVCGVLDLSNPTMAARSIDEDALSTAEVIDSMGRKQQARVVAEAGVYELVFQSRKPEAREFRRWVTREVLPEIRKTGSFGGVAVNQIPDMNTPQGQLQVAELLAAGARKQIEQAAEIKQLKPKADYVDAYVDGAADATILRIVAKQLQVGEKWLRTLLVDKKIVARRIVGTRWSNSQRRNITQYEWYARRGYETWFVQRDQPEAPRLHNGQMQTTLYVTPVGKVQIAGLVTRAGEAS